jgi:hypothetical protein
MGAEGWNANNPLHMIIRTNTITYWTEKVGRLTDPVEDVMMMNMFLDAGADINRRPYIWAIVFGSDTEYLHDIRTRHTRYGKYEKYTTTAEEDAREGESYIGDRIRLLKAFLDAGADPDKLGHRYPFEPDRKDFFMTDEEAAGYFANGTRAINEAIKKGMVWESQVDLLLEYTTLDEDSLKAAEESGDPGMVEKIHRLWREQNLSP